MAGDALFQRHFDALYRFFQNKAGPVSLDDLVQQTFLACVNGRDTFREESTFRTFMFAIARRVLYRELGRRHRDRERFDPASVSLHDVDPTPSRILADRSEARLLLEGLRRIRLDYQMALELYYFEGLRGPALAECLGIPEPTVRSWLRRGLDQLRQAMADLAESPTLLESTLGDLDGWAAQVRAILDAPSAEHPEPRPNV